MKKYDRLGRRLSKTEQKKISGGFIDPGDGGGGGQCIGCYQYGTQYYSCWYSTRGCDVCTAVYGSNSQCLGPVGCGGCVMN